MSPILVVEVLFDADPYKDLVRNVDLYLQVPSIREYWLLDARYSADEPTLIVHRRRGKRLGPPRVSLRRDVRDETAAGVRAGG